MEQSHLQSLIRNFVADVNIIFPAFEFSYSSAFGANDNFSSFKVDFSNRQSALNNTNYTKNLGNIFIHYTSLSNLSNILNSNSIRLHNIGLMNDPQELNFISQKLHLNIDDSLLKRLKKTLHVFSLSSYSGSENFSLWQRYGLDGTGVGIVFDIEKHNWANFLIGEVQYRNSKNSEQKLKRLFKVLQVYTKKGLEANNLPINFLLMLLFHKNNIWKNEKEFRIVSYFDYDEDTLELNETLNSHWDNKLINFYTSNSGELGTFLSIPLNYNLKNLSSLNDDKINESDFQFIPHIRIKEILLGYRTNHDIQKNVSQLVSRYNSQNATKIILRKSNLSSHFQ